MSSTLPLVGKLVNRFPPLMCAVEKVGVEVVLIADNKIVGIGYCISMADGVVSIEMRDEPAKALIADSTQVKLWTQSFEEKKFKYSTFKFCMFTGNYLDMSHADPDMKCDGLKNVRVVNKANLRYGAVPESFRDAESYRGFFIDHESNAKIVK